MPIVLLQPFKLLNAGTVDDSSTSSTVPAVEPVKPKRRRVRFASKDANQYYENHLICQEDLKVECWYTTRDYKRFRQSALEASLQIVQLEERNRAPFSYRRVLEHTYNACREQTTETTTTASVLPASEFVHLQRWVEVASCRIGLEKWSVRAIAADKSARRKAINEVVRDHQGPPTDDDEEEEELRETCMHLSRPSRLFARTMAEATAAAVRKDSLGAEAEV